ncbi:MAG: hypothetical protein F6J87_25435 [Spirulina sp. SIO3F2]|nr:hypothetical protein [Spirulina sp. SIO3F2]
MLLSACGSSGLEACKVVEIEKPEAEFDIKDIDIERGEVEMVCGDEIVDVTWGEFDKKLGVNPEDYLEDLEGFKSEFGECLIDTGSNKKELQCKNSGSEDYTPVKFSYDD